MKIQQDKRNHPFVPKKQEGILKNMQQRQTLLLWKKHENIDAEFDSVFEQFVALLKVFSGYPGNLRPNFDTAWIKEEAKSIPVERKELYTWLRNHRVPASKKHPSDYLGYSASMFSSQNKLESSGFQFSVGNKSDMFVNSLVIHLPIQLSCHDREMSELIFKLFCELCETFKPFYGCVSNSVIMKKQKKYMRDGLPTTIHWANFWDTDIINLIGKQKIEGAKSKFPLASYENGFFRIRETMIDSSDPDDMEYCKKMQDFILGEK